MGGAPRAELKRGGEAPPQTKLHAPRCRASINRAARVCYLAGYVTRRTSSEGVSGKTCKAEQRGNSGITIHLTATLRECFRSRPACLSRALLHRRRVKCWMCSTARTPGVFQSAASDCMRNYPADLWICKTLRT